MAWLYVNGWNGSIFRRRRGRQRLAYSLASEKGRDRLNDKIFELQTMERSDKSKSGQWLEGGKETFVSLSERKKGVLARQF